MIAALAGPAIAGGAGLAWQIERSRQQSQTIDPGFWRLAFSTPDGLSLQMSALRGRPLLLNFWATWCPPCVEELPLLSRFHEEYSSKGWQVLGLAVDQIDPVKRFLTQTRVSFPVALAGLSGVEISRSLGNSAGALPFTAVIEVGGAVHHRKMGRVTADELRNWAALK